MDKNFLTVDDLLNEKTLKPKFKYWDYDSDYITCHYAKWQTYDIPVLELRSPGGICSWLGQIAEKTWANKFLLGEMVQLVNYIVGDLRGLR